MRAMSARRKACDVGKGILAPTNFGDERSERRRTMSHRNRKPARHGAAGWLRLTLALLVTLSALAALPTRVARAAACMVISAADTGVGSLRAAINNTDG